MNNAIYNQIRIFQCIAREGSISAAARKLVITPPSVSNALKLLEQHIGHPLFVRTTRRIELTETGQQLLEQTAAAVEPDAHSWAMDAYDHYPESVIRGKSMGRI